MVTEKTTLNELFEQAKKSTEDVSTNEKYIVKDLFRGFEWNRIPKGFRTKLGGMYLRDVEEKRIKNIKALGKTAQNQQIYIKEG